LPDSGLRGEEEGKRGRGGEGGVLPPAEERGSFLAEGAF
jgi:hypothetical protein